MNTPSSPSPHRLPQPNGTAGRSEQPHATPPHRLTPQEAALRGASLAFQKQQHQAQEGGHTHKTGVGYGGSLSRQTTGASSSGSNVNGGAGRISRQPTGSSVRSQRDYADEAAEKERERERKALFLSSSTTATPELGGGGKGSQHLLQLPPGARPSGALTESRSASFIAATLAVSRSASPGTASGAEHGAAAGVLRRSPLREPVGSRRGSAVSAGGLEGLTDTTSLAPATSLISLFEKHGDTDELVRSPDRPVKRKPKLRSPKPPGRDERGEEAELGRGSGELSSKPNLRASRARLDVTYNDDSGAARVTSSPQPRMGTDTVKTSPSRPARKPKPVSPKPKAGLGDEDVETGRKSIESKSTSRPSPKPKPRVITRAETPPPPVFRRADTEIVSPKPRRPKMKPRLEVPVSSSESNENSEMTVEKEAKAGPKALPESAKASPNDVSQANQSEIQTAQRPNALSKSPVISVKSRPPAPRKSSGLSERLPPELRRQSTRRQSVISTHDGQEASKPWSGQDVTNPRPTTSDSKSSNDSFVSASSVPTRDDADSLLTVEALSSRSVTPKGRTSRPASAQPSTPLPIRQSATGSSQLTLDSLSNAIMAGSLASARHTPASLNDSRTPPPPLPPSRRKGGTSTKHKPSSRRPSPHRMKHTLRQPKALSDDEEARRPHHKKGLNHKKHAHHEGSRSRWREEITEREKKRYEAVWASNRGALLVTATQQASSDPDRRPASHHHHHQQQQPPLRNESHEEELSEHVANVVVRDLWRRSRLPEPELAEVWDLVYGHSRAPGRVVHGALKKQEFVVGMWLIDQRLRGRKIPPRVSESVWSSATGVRVLSPEQRHGVHGHGHRGKGKGR